MDNNLGKEFAAQPVYFRIKDVESKRIRCVSENLSRIGSIFAYEISKKLEYKSREIITPLGTSEMKVLKKTIR